MKHLGGMTRLGAPETNEMFVVEMARRRRIQLRSMLASTRRFSVAGVLGIFTLTCGVPIRAQTAVPTRAASAPAATASGPSEAVQRQALGPYRLILLNANPVVRPKAPTAAAGAGAAATATVVRESGGAKPSAAAQQTQGSAPGSSKETATNTAAAANTVNPATGVASKEPAPTTAQNVPVGAANTSARALEQAAPPLAALALPNSTAAASPGVVNAAVAATAKPPLVPLRQEAPVLTGALLREAAAGVVKVAFDVKPDGSTTAVRVSSSTNRKLNGAAVAAVAKWQFAPIDDTRQIEVDLVFATE